MPLIDGVPLDNPGMRWAHRATSEPLPSYDADLSDLKRTGRDGVVSLAGTTSPVVLRIVVQTPRENLESLIALFRQGKVWSNGGRETPFEFKSISPTGFGPADQVIDAAFVIRLPGAFMRAKDPETTALALTGTSHTLSCFAAHPVGVVSQDKNLFTNPRFETAGAAVTVRTNVNLNPRIFPTANGWSTTPTSATLTATASGVQVDVTTAPGGAILYNSANVTSANGDRWTAGIEVEVPLGFPAATIALRVYSYGQEASIADSGAVTLQPGSRTIIQAPSILAATAATTGVRMILYGVAPTAVGTRLIARNAILEKSAYLGPYFDGSSQPVLRTNRVTNPVPTSITGWSSANTATATYGSSDILVACAPGVLDSGVRIPAGPIYIGESVTYSVEVEGVTAGTWMWSVAGLTGGTQTSAPFPVTAGEIKRVSFTVTGTSAASAPAVYILRRNASGSETIRVRKAQAEVGSVTTSYFAGSSVATGFGYGWTGGANASPSVEWDADFATAWTGSIDGSTSNLNAVRVAAPTAGQVENNALTVQSSRGAVTGRSVRVIPTGASTDSQYQISGYNVTFFQPGKTYTVLATLTLLQAQTGTSSVWARRITAVDSINSGANVASPQPPNAPGIYPQRITFTVPLSAAWAVVRLYAGTAQGGGDACWDDVTIIEGIYTGPGFHGATPSPDRLTSVAWDGLPDQSSSTRVVYSSWDGGFSAPVQDAVIRVKGAATGIQVTDSSGAWAILPDVPAGQWIRFETDTGRAYQTATDVWTGGIEVSGLVDFGGPRGVFEITPVMAPGDPGSRSGQVTVTTASRTGAVIEVRGKAAYLL